MPSHSASCPVLGLLVNSHLVLDKASLMRAELCSVGNVSFRILCGHSNASFGVICLPCFFSTTIILSYVQLLIFRSMLLTVMICKIFLYKLAISSFVYGRYTHFLLPILWDLFPCLLGQNMRYLGKYTALGGMFCRIVSIRPSWLLMLSSSLLLLMSFCCLIAKGGGLTSLDKAVIFFPFPSSSVSFCVTILPLSLYTS